MTRYNFQPSSSLSLATDETQIDTDDLNCPRSLNLCKSVFHLWLVVILLVPATLRAEPKPEPKPEPNKPNIVVFLAGDMGWGDSATHGHELIQTPSLDKLASR